MIFTSVMSGNDHSRTSTKSGAHPCGLSLAFSFDGASNFRLFRARLAFFGSEFVISYGAIFAVGMVVVVPIGIVVFIFRRCVVIVSAG